MTISLPCLDDYKETFPDVESALTEPDGLLAFGGDLSPERIIKAYRSGIFPWFSEQDPILWWSPATRAVIEANQFSPSKSLRKHIRRNNLTVTLNQATEQVITLCASTRPIEETWITQEMINAYIELTKLGHCHSVEVWRNDTLIGGLYGIKLGQLFCGESMFSLESNASKVAFWYLCNHFAHVGGQLIDCQIMNPHLKKLGVSEVARSDFISLIKQLQSKPINTDFTPCTLELIEG
ncbi:leucyl/phenylalanyl-tRNA--protein transferase [Vibrio algivorus]|uniref:leucyl/phenylalanyl-tRNA--protein transferase n=1 Tax=Vibrio algivorus TaxID=1667024 RepID=UPI001FD1D018|nr:leucyl/phenylalanyl-tRNA--protein transferase [Vibrio algivorus]